MTKGRIPANISDDALWQQARELGLAPPQQAQQPGGQRAEAPDPRALHQLHSCFRGAALRGRGAEQDVVQVLLGPEVAQLVGPAAPVAEPAAAGEPAAQQLGRLRQRWQRQLQAALGLLQQQLAPGPLHEADVLDLGGPRPEGSLGFEALDGSCATDLLHEQDLQPVLLGKRSWACCSPFTGSGWKRARVS